MGANLATAPAKKPSSLATLQASFARVKAQAEKAKDNATMLAREVVTTGETCATSFAVGFADELYGKPDELGVKIHKTSDVPTALMGGGAVKLFAGFGMFGEFGRDAMAMGSGALAAYTTTQGRRAAIAFAQRRAAQPAADKTTTKTEEKKAA